MTENTPSPEETTIENEPARRVRWLFPTIVVILALIVHLVGRQMVDDDKSIQSLVMILTWFFAFLLIGLWWTFFSGIKWKTRLLGIGGFVGTVALFLVLFRFDGQSGNFIPEYSFRFSKSAEDRALEYFSTATTKTIAAKSESENSSEKAIKLSDTDWPMFGGPNHDHIVNQPIRVDWDTSPPKELWRHPIGPAWSSFAVVGDSLFTQEQRGEFECVVCYDAKTGEQIWVHEDKTRFEEPAGGPGPRATPTFHDSKLFALGAKGILNCLDPVTGKLIWSAETAKENGGDTIEWAASGSPVIHENLVLVNPGTSESFLVAYDRKTGNKVWKAPSERAAYSTPVVAKIDGQTQIVMYRSAGVGGYSIATGEQLWFYGWTNTTKINCSQPIVMPDETVFVSTGYGGGSILLDVSESDGEWEAKTIWERPNKFKLKFNGGIYKDGFVYGLDEGILSCFEVESGKRKWRKGRYDYGQVLMVNDKLLVLTEQGDVVLVDANPEKFTELTQFKAIKGKTWNHPVLSKGRLFVRNASEVACFDLSPSKE